MDKRERFDLRLQGFAVGIILGGGAFLWAGWQDTDRAWREARAVTVTQVGPQCSDGDTWWPARKRGPQVVCFLADKPK